MCTFRRFGSIIFKIDILSKLSSFNEPISYNIAYANVKIKTRSTLKG